MWAAARIRRGETPAWCRAGSDHASAKLLPVNQTSRGLLMYDPKTKKLTAIDTCFSWGHINFDDNDVLWSSFGPAGVEGWFDVKMWDKTHDEKASQGWSAFVLDNNGNGKRDAYTEPNQPADPAKDRRLNVQFYGDSPAPDGSVWGSVQGMPGAVVRFVPGAHPPETALAEYYEVPWNNPKAPMQGFAPRGMDVDSKGVVWTVLSSGQLPASIERNAPGLSPVPRLPDSIVPKDGRCIRCRDRTTKERSKTRAPIRPTMISSIDSTCSASARMCRLRLEIFPKDCSHWWTGSS